MDVELLACLKLAFRVLFKTVLILQKDIIINPLIKQTVSLRLGTVSKKKQRNIQTGTLYSTCLIIRGGKSTDIFYLSRSTDTRFKKYSK